VPCTGISLGSPAQNEQTPTIKVNYLQLEFLNFAASQPAVCGKHGPVKRGFPSLICLSDLSQLTQLISGECSANITGLSLEWLVVIPDSPPQLCFLEYLREEQDFLVDAPSPNVFFEPLRCGN
jgi:hypothetical protein